MGLRGTLYWASTTRLTTQSTDRIRIWEGYQVDRNSSRMGNAFTEVVAGRYANRIKNSTFEIDGVEYHVVPNEHNGQDTLHGGPNGWDWVMSQAIIPPCSILLTFSSEELDGRSPYFRFDYLFTCRSGWRARLPWRSHQLCHVYFDAIPVAPQDGSIFNHKENANNVDFPRTRMILHMRRVITDTPQTYWNLDGFQNNGTATALNHTLHLPYSGMRIGTDGILIPNGTLLPNHPGSVNDFWSAPKQIGANFSSPDMVGNCGTGCIGYDTCYLVNREQNGPYNWRTEGPVATLASAFSGIQLDIYSDQQAFQVYSCGGQNGRLQDCSNIVKHAIY